MKTREIKFRAWDGKKMYIPVSLLNDPIQCGYIDGSGCPKYCKDILMEYTGLKDKNGKEIYEGDIVDCNNTNNKSIVEWDVYQWIFKLIPYNQQVATLKSHSIVEVIGNIYQDSHLLK